MKNEATPANHAALLAHIQAKNAKTLAWVAEDPTNRWAGTLVEDLDHWTQDDIHTPEAFEHYMLATAAYDAHKDAYGFKPDWRVVNAMSDSELREWLDHLFAECERQVLEQEAAEKAKADEFEARIQDVIESGAGDRATALRWIMDAEIPEEDRGTQLATADYVRWSLGLPYSYESEFKTILA